MTTLSFTTYVSAPVDDVRDRLTTTEKSAPEGAEVEVSPLVDRTRIVVRVPWAPRNEAQRRSTSLAAGRYSTSITELAAA